MIISLKSAGVLGVASLLSLSTWSQVIERAVPLQIADATGSVVGLPVSNGTDTVQLGPDTVIDISEIPADNLSGLGSNSGVLLIQQPGGSPQAPLENLDQGDDRRRIVFGVEACDDDDGDGVCNSEDYCTDTPPGSIIMPSGCHLSPKAPLELVGVFFDFNGANLRPESYEILDRVVALLLQQHTVLVEIGGHSDALGSRSANLQLSSQRAKAVHDYLIKRGIAPFRLSYKGYGDSQPVAPNELASGVDYPSGRARNRRVDMRVTGDTAQTSASSGRQ